MDKMRIINNEGIDITELLTELYLNSNDIPHEDMRKEDRRFSTRGWQYRHYGNSSEGKQYLKELSTNDKYLLLCSANIDHSYNKDNSTFHTEYAFESNDNYIHVRVNPSRSGATTTYIITKVNKIDLGV